MILDNALSYNQKIYISMMAGALWIYFRTQKCYAALPRKSILATILVVTWIYLNYKDPLFLPIGLGLMLAYAYN